MKRIIESILKRTLTISCFSVVVLVLSACEKPKPELGLKTGIWRGEIRAQKMPFLLTSKSLKMKALTK